ncbi:MAG: glycosyltransferase family 39 protein [Actinomycetota bacterium]|nr:glycosyltransferase family 39 protein [Actinomycetota bacterium]
MASPVTAERSRSDVDRRTWRLDAAALAVAAVLLRIPAFVADRHLTYDDGFFGLSALEMRHGVVPFQELFSPQGPLFLPLLYVADLVGLRTANAPRVLPLVAGAAATIATYAAGRRIASRRGALLAAVLVTTSGSVLFTTTGIASDGPAIAFAVAAVAVALGYARTPTTDRAIGAGALIGAAVVAKALAAPASLAVVLLLLSRRRYRDLAYAVGAGVAVALAASVPWGLDRVWEQSVAYNRDASRLTSYPGAATKAFHTLTDRDPYVLVAAGLALAVVALALVRRPGTPRPSSPTREPLLFRPAVILLVWLGAQFALLVYEPAFWRPHVAHLIAPLALLIALRPPPLALLLVGAVAVTPWYVGNMHSLLWPDSYNRQEQAAVDALRRIPADRLVISDEPGLLWRAERLTVPYFDDSSIKRIEQGQITAAKLAAAAAKPDVCGVLVWTRRYADLDLAPRLMRSGYEEAARFGGVRVLYEKPACRPA